MLKFTQQLIAGLIGMLASPSIDGFVIAADDGIENPVTHYRPSAVQTTPGGLTGTECGTTHPVWSAPAPQTRGARWIYELFTPPEIYYDEDSKQFEVARGSNDRTAEGFEKAEDVEASFGLQLKGVKRSLFRLQLIGFIKTSNAQLGLFEIAETAEVIVAPGGTVLNRLGLLIESLAIRAEEVSSPEMTPVQETRAIALIRDQATGRVTRLTSAERSLDPEPRATLVSVDSLEEVHEVSQGDSVRVHDITYEVAEIRVSPPEVIVLRRGEDPEPAERHTLNLPEVSQPLATIPPT